MAELNDDAILEIVKRLPLKYAMQCTVLNKNIHRSISCFLPSYTTIFRCSRNNPKIFTMIWRESGSTPSHTSVILDAMASIKASCNGLLLLGLKNDPGCNFSSHGSNYYVFNPTTAAIMAVDRVQIEIHTSVGLAVPADNSQFKLVAVFAQSTRLVFTVLAPSLTGEYVYIKSRVDLDCRRGFKLATDEAVIRPVYAHGSFYWLGDDGTAMVAFDAEKEEGRLIDGPVGTNEFDGVYKWFGLAGGAIHFVYASRSEIVICRHDHKSGEWRVRNTIPNVYNNPRNNNFLHGMPLFFDGQWLLFGVRKCGEGGHFYIYNLERDLWEKIGSLGSWADNVQDFLSYNPTFVHVSDTYVNDKNTSLKEYEKASLLRLQQFLSPA